MILSSTGLFCSDSGGGMRMVGEAGFSGAVGVSEGRVAGQEFEPTPLEFQSAWYASLLDRLNVD